MGANDVKDQFSQTMVMNLKDLTPGEFELTFLGSGSAFTMGDNPHTMSDLRQALSNCKAMNHEPIPAEIAKLCSGNYQSNALLTNKSTGEHLLIDAGGDIRFSLAEQGLKAKDIGHIFISHLHNDHIGGLEGIAFMTKFDPSARKPNLIISQPFAQDLWSDCLRGGLGSLEGEIAELSSFFNINEVPVKSGRFDWEGLKFQMVQVVHIISGFRITPSFGLMFQVNGVRVFFTSDTQMAPEQMKKFYEMADVIFHDCETSLFKSGVHAHYNDLRTLPEKFKAKMFLYHYHAGPKPDCVAAGFRGWVLKGQKFTLDSSLIE